MKKSLSILVCLLWPAFVFSQETITVSFENLAEMIETQNLKVQGSRDFLKAAHSRTKHLQRSFLPNIKVYGGGESFQTGNQGRRTEGIAGIEGRMNLFRGGRDYLEEKLRKEAATLEEFKFKKSSLNELTRARNLFVNILFLKELNKHYREALSNNKSNLAQVQIRIDAGITSETDKLEFEINRSQLKQKLAILDKDLKYSIGLLKTFLGLSITPQIGSQKIRIIRLPKTFNSRTHPNVSILQKKKEILNIEEKQTKLWWTPSVGLYASYSLYPFREREQSSFENRDETVVGIQMHLNLFDGLKSQKKVQSLKYKSSGYQKIALQKERELEVYFDRLKNNLKLRHKLIQSTARNVSRGQQHLVLSREEYNLGTKNSLDLLSASERLLKLKLYHSEARKNFLMTKNEMLNLLNR